MKFDYFWAIGRGILPFGGIANAVGAFCHLVSGRVLVVMVVVGGEVWYLLVLARLTSLLLLSFSFLFFFVFYKQ